MAFSWKRALTWLIVLGLLTGLGFFVIEVIRGEPPITELMLSTITLYSTNDTVQRSQFITDMDGMVKQLRNDAIKAQWAALTGCMGTNTCTQDDYFDLLLVTTIENPKKVPHADLVLNMITINRYWDNAEKLLEFSQAVTSTDKQVRMLDLQTVSSKWQEILACDATCPNYHLLFFEMMGLLVSV